MENANLMNVSGGFTDIEVVDEHNLQYKTNKRLIAIVHEDEQISLSREKPYENPPGSSCWNSHYYTEGALARRFKFVMGTPVTPSEIEGLIARNKDLEEKAASADRRVSDAAKEFEKKIKEQAEELAKEREGRSKAETHLSIAEKRKDEAMSLKDDAKRERDEAVKALAAYKEKVSEVMLLVPDRGELSVADLVESADVAETMGGGNGD